MEAKELLREGRELDPKILLTQMGHMNVFAISGGRGSVINYTDSEGETYPIGVSFPVAKNRSVEVTLDWTDLYLVRRIRKVVSGQAKGSEVVEEEHFGVFCDVVGDVAYFASCWK